MKPGFFTYSNLSNTIINNASKDYTEFLLMQIMNESKKQVIFINEDFSQDRLLKNLEFLGINNVIFLSDFSEGVYNFSSVKIEGGARFILEAGRTLTEDANLIIIDYKLLLKKIPPLSFFQEKIVVERGKKLSYASFIQKLLEFGFTRCENVYEIGEIAVRGFIIDIGILSGFYRIEFEGEKVISIFHFNTETQRKEKGDTFSEVIVLPVKMAIFKEEEIEIIKERLHNFDIQGSQDFLSKIDEFYSLSLHNYLPLFYESTSSILSFFKKDAVFVSSSLLNLRLLEIQKEAKRNYDEYKNEGRFVLPPDILFESFSLSRLNTHIQLSEFAKETV
jgi:transcription-repair coupling factor (superfamily II helicase)